MKHADDRADLEVSPVSVWIFMTMSTLMETSLYNSNVFATHGTISL
jgi:hypothetical protein